jgi:hypothetical protein
VKQVSGITVTQPGSLLGESKQWRMYYYIDSIWVQRDCYMNVPNAFTPDGDGLNDYFLTKRAYYRVALKPLQ